MSLRPFLSTLGFAALLGMQGPALRAQDVRVDAGSLTRQTEIDAPDDLDDRRRERPGQLLSVPAPGGAAVAAGGDRILVRGWGFSGNTIYSDAVLAQVLKPYTGRALTFAEIHAAAAAVESYYVRQGYIVQTSIPAQEVVDDRVRIEVLEARFAGVRFEGDAPARMRPGQIARIFSGAVPEGGPVQPDRFDRPLLLANDLPGVTVSGAFAPGRNPRETLLALSVTDTAPFSGQATADNHGPEATGEARLSLQGSAVSPLRRGDLLTADLSASEGIRSGKLSYSLPLGARGLRAGVSVEALEYEVIENDLAALDASGNSRAHGVELSYPLRRSRNFNLNVTAEYDSARYRNRVGGNAISDYDLRQARIGLSGYWFDDLGGGGASSFGLSFASGRTEGGDGDGALDDSFHVLRLDLTRQQALGDRSTLYAALSAQHGPRGLDSSESFTLGGPNGVRGHESGAASGPSGMIVNLELWHRLSDTWQVKGFYDYGRIADRDAPGERSAYDLQGAGLSAIWSGPHGFNADITWARRLGDNPYGSNDENRFWLSLTKTF